VGEKKDKGETPSSREKGGREGESGRGKDSICPPGMVEKAQAWGEGGAPPFTTIEKEGI